MSDRLDNIKKVFRDNFGGDAQKIAIGPGRVDLMGIHTDYNEGYVLPVAVNVDVLAAGALRSDRTIRVYSSNLNKMSEFSIESIQKDTIHPWSNYVRGVLLYLAESGVVLQGADIALHGNVPIGSGLSSSAALEMATGVLMQGLLGFEMGGPQMALIGQKAENRFVGVNTGIMDQFISRLGKKNHALFIDCRTLAYEHYPLDTTAYRVVVCDTAKRRGLVDSEYDLRRSQCNEAVELFKQWKPGITALRDISITDFEEHKKDLPYVVRMRAEHVIYENDRGLRSRAALSSGDFPLFGQLMNESHNSARDLYEVSCPELEAMVEVSRKAPGALCGRLAGAGFGGCTVSLVASDQIDAFVQTVAMEYNKKTHLKPSIYVCTAEDGARILE